MNFTREPIIETIISPKDGYKLCVRNSKVAGAEEFFVDAIEVVSFGNSFFFRGIERPKPFLVPVSDYEIFEVNVFGIFHTCRQIIPVMKEQKSGHIINISSTAGLESMPMVGAYCGSKHAVRAMSETMFKELREYGVKVTTVFPGSVKTDFFRNSPGIKPHDNMMSAEEVAEQIIFQLESSSNFVCNEIVFRPLIAKPKS